VDELGLAPEPAVHGWSADAGPGGDAVNGERAVAAFDEEVPSRVEERVVDRRVPGTTGPPARRTRQRISSTSTPKSSM
jgi:hypothetical protein